MLGVETEVILRASMRSFPNMSISRTIYRASTESLAVYFTVCQLAENLSWRDTRCRHRCDVINRVWKGGVDIPSPVSGDHGRIQVVDQICQPSKNQERDNSHRNGPEEKTIIGNRDECFRDSSTIGDEFCQLKNNR